VLQYKWKVLADGNRWEAVPHREYGTRIRPPGEESWAAKGDVVGWRWRVSWGLIVQGFLGHCSWGDLFRASCVHIQCSQKSGHQLSLQHLTSKAGAAILTTLRGLSALT